VPAEFKTRELGAPGTSGTKTVEPVAAADASDSPISFTATILAQIC